MTASGPGDGDTPDGPDDAPVVPEYVWRLFLEDDERAIHASAPREPAARDRTPGRTRPEPPADCSGHPGRAHDTVGEPWRREDAWAGPAWRELDRRARLRRTGRVLGTAAAVALAVTAWSQLTTGPATPGGGPAETIGQRLEESPALPSPASVADTPASAESAGASPAAFEPAPSAIPRAPASTRTFG
ncbi:hypothetical protein [Streptomyces anthocyanicus]|uniref:hypothetical protein n=1 Tax=Streptomyces anthocyanicus TaxID=68174 RepID=UPI0017828E99|nr:hypothetical protein [Streptomyces anthocyanicus]WTC48610.1 hypothetical protein OG855_13020 [Streptomyces anthocyanicus]GHA41714.1 hypothetical protein GCM10010391_27400 [Streptomyces anthocyanicus]